jgi:hypothetical protein
MNQSYITYLFFLIINIFTAKLVLWQLLCFSIVFLLAYELFSLFANKFLHLNSFGKRIQSWCGKVSSFVVVCNSGLPSSKGDKKCLNVCISTLYMNMTQHIILHTAINRFRNMAERYIYSQTAKFRLSFLFRTVTVSVFIQSSNHCSREFSVRFTFVLNFRVCTNVWF